MGKPSSVHFALMSVVFAALPLIYAQSRIEANNLSKEAGSERDKIQADIAQNHEAAARARTTLGRAQSLRQRAQSQNDSQSAAVAQRAIDAAEATLRRLRQAEAQDKARLQALEKGQGDKGKPP